MKPKILLPILAALIVLSGFICKENTTVPEGLVGKWTTEDPKYEGCFLELMKDTIVFGTAEGDSDRGTIKNIKKEKSSTISRVFFTISYVDQAQLEYKLPIYYFPEEGGIIRFKNQQQIIWTKEKQ